MGHIQEFRDSGIEGILSFLIYFILNSQSNDLKYPFSKSSHLLTFFFSAFRILAAA